MKYLYCLLLIFSFTPALSQLNDSFDDGRFFGTEELPRTVNWYGDRDNFRINESFQLQLDAPSQAGRSQLRTSSSRTINTVWEFYLKSEFTLTTNNYCKVYLASDAEDFNSSLNGLSVRIGYTDKNICLIYEKPNKNNKILIKGGVKRLAGNINEVNVRLSFDKYGNIRLYSKLDKEKEYKLEGECVFNEQLKSEWFGVLCIYTKTRYDMFSFDNILVREMREDEQGEDPGDTPEPGEYESALPYDILFSEIMANPKSGEPEYIELYNASDKTFLLSDYLFYYGDKSLKLPEKELLPQAYCVLTKTTALSFFDADINACGVVSFPTLANKGKLLMLKNKKDSLISWLEYSDKWYVDSSKKSGGWSLECIDLSNLSNTSENWNVSNDSSGCTPGKLNSTAASNPDITIPRIDTYSFSGNKIKMSFSKYMDKRTLLDKSSYVINSNSDKTNDYSIINLETNYPQGSDLSLELNKELAEDDLFEIELKGIADMSGNMLADNTILIGYGLEAEPLDVVINELLFNPPPGGTEYLELYNRSESILDLRFLSITSRKPSDASFNKLYPLSETSLFIYPKEYLLISKSMDSVCEHYTCIDETFCIELPIMPPLANASGCVVIVNNQSSEIIDEFAYNDKMHDSEIKTKKGVSLERQNIDLPTEDQDNWKSASENCGFGTPGYENSKSSIDQPSSFASENKLSVEYPNRINTNYEIKYQLDKEGYMARLYIYDSEGRLVTTLLDNEVLSEAQGMIAWDGQSNTNRPISSGIYIIYMEIYDKTGRSSKMKIPVVTTPNS